MDGWIEVETSSSNRTVIPSLKALVVLMAISRKSSLNCAQKGENSIGIPEKKKELLLEDSAITFQRPGDGFSVTSWHYRMRFLSFV